MHIPAIATSEMEVLSFAEAMRQSGREAGYDTARWLYVPDFYTEYRYVLGTKGENPLKITLLNAWMGRKPVMPA